MNYQLYELNHAALSPLRAVADATRLYFRNPANPMAYTPFGRSIVAALEVFERTTRVYGKPAFGISSTVVGGVRVPVREEVVWAMPFCRLIRFVRGTPEASAQHPRLLIVAPMSGHYATLLRGTVEEMLPRHDVYITDWTDARTVPLSAGRFDLDTYIDYLIGILHHLGPNTHVMAVCQPAVPALAATAVMEAAGDPAAPASLILMGGPIDTRINPTEVNHTAKKRGIDWFRRNVIMTVPFPYPGFMRRVYPGFLQLSGFLAMNYDRHYDAHRIFYDSMVKGDGDSTRKHREFYDEYLAVMDLTAEFFLQTVETVFLNHDLPDGRMMYRSTPVDLTKIVRTALFTIEGEKDDISGVGQTEATQALCTGIPADRKHHYLQLGVGHYGVFNGSRFRSEIAPRIADFVWTFDRAPRRSDVVAQPAAAEPAPVEEAAPVTAEAPVADVPVADVPVAETRIAEAPVAEAAVADVPAAEPAAAPAPAQPETASETAAEAAPTAQSETAAPEAAAGDQPHFPGFGPPAEAAPDAAAEPAAEPATKARAAKARTPRARAVPKDRGAVPPLGGGLGGATGDNLGRIKGVGPSIAKALRDLGYASYADIAALDADGIARIEERIGFPGRVERDDWIGQARALLATAGA
ncbi:polyhydroxyalkanoate depolymerase [Pseudoxanthobacter sp.]|uniref:polyhydroxyalkanoate depolymerase n=1 Tax=Pseudoxanthobacter sp. TaxID=1925742 RepID=UPI002FE3F8F1